jgi:hypothetical protein
MWKIHKLIHLERVRCAFKVNCELLFTMQLKTVLKMEKAQKIKWMYFTKKKKTQLWHRLMIQVHYFTLRFYLFSLFVGQMPSNCVTTVTLFIYSSKLSATQRESIIQTTQKCLKEARSPVKVDFQVCYVCEKSLCVVSKTTSNISLRILRWYGDSLSGLALVFALRASILISLS